MTYSDESSADSFWNERARRGRRTDRTREHTAVTKGMRRPGTDPTPKAGDVEPPLALGAGLFDDIPDDPFEDDFGLGSYAALSGAARASDHLAVDHELVLEPTPRRSSVGVDPLLLRIGAIVVAAVVSVPIISAVGAGDSGDSGDAVMSQENAFPHAPRSGAASSGRRQTRPIGTRPQA